MKKIILALAFLSVSIGYTQAFNGKGDIKAQVGAVMQEGGRGIVFSADFGMADNISFGLVTSYLLSDNAKPAKFFDKADFKGRFNANIGNVFGLSKKMDIYPGLDLSLKNFGGHVGFRYFFSDGFGLFAESGMPIATYKTTVTGYDKLNNQYYLNIGASFNL